MLKFSLILVVSVFLSVLNFVVASQPAPEDRANVCDLADCTIELEFDNGGLIEFPDGGVITFGENADINLGLNGMIELGSESIFTGLSQRAFHGHEAIPEKSRVEFAPKSDIQFGLNGFLYLGVGGNISFNDEQTVSVNNASRVDIKGDDGARVTLEAVHTTGVVSLHGDEGVSITGLNHHNGLLINSADTRANVSVVSSYITVHGDRVSAGQSIVRGPSTVDPCHSSDVNSGSLTESRIEVSSAQVDVALDVRCNQVLNVPESTLVLEAPEEQLQSSFRPDDERSSLNQDGGGGVFSLWILFIFLVRGCQSCLMKSRVG